MTRLRLEVCLQKCFDFSGKVESKRKENFWEDEKCKKDILGFLEQNKRDIETIIGVITSDKNDVLYETIGYLTFSHTLAICLTYIRS